MKIFGREPMYWLGFLAAALEVIAAFGVHVSATQQTYINTFAAAGVAVAAAIVLHTGALAAALANLAQAGMALAVGFGLDWSTDTQGKVMAAVGALLTLWLRERVTPPVPTVPLEQRSPVKAGTAR